jgi:hypothetical protein
MSTPDFRMARARALATFGAVAAVAALTAGCATIDDAPTQQLEIHTILDYREVGGVGCVLSNPAGRWFVVAPGRVTVERSRAPLSIDCAREGAGNALEQAPARSMPMLDSAKLIGNIVVRAGIGGYVRHDDAAGMYYQPTLTVLMRPATGPGALQAQPEADPGNPMF